MTNMDWKMVAELLMFIFAAVNIIYWLLMLRMMNGQQAHVREIESYAGRLSETIRSMEAKHRYLEEGLQQAVRSSRLDFDALQKELDGDMQHVREAVTANAEPVKESPAARPGTHLVAAIAAQKDSEAAAAAERSDRKNKNGGFRLPENWLRKTGLLD